MEPVIPDTKTVDLGSDGTTGLMTFKYGDLSVIVDPLLEMDRIFEITEKFIDVDPGGKQTVRAGCDAAIQKYVSELLNPSGGTLVSVSIASRVVDSIRLHCEELKKRTEDWLKSLTTTESTRSR